MFVINDKWIHIRACVRLYFFWENNYVSFVIINECRNMKLNSTKQQPVEAAFSELTFLLAQTSSFADTHAKTDVECLENQYYLLGQQQEPLRIWARQDHNEWRPASATDRRVLFRKIKIRPSSYRSYLRRCPWS